MTTDLHSLVAAYALDALDGGERIEFEAHLATCTSCPAELAEFAEVVAGLAEATSVVPPADLRDRVLSRIGEIEQVPRRVPSNERRERRAFAPVVRLTERRRKLPVAHLLFAAAAAILLFVGTIVILDPEGGSDFDDVASASDAIVAQLTGASGSVDLAYSAQLDRVAVRGEAVDDLEPGLRYALWAIADGKPIPAGLFDTDDGSIDEAVELADVDAEAWGITIEPETGADTPTGKILYYAEI